MDSATPVLLIRSDVGVAAVECSATLEDSFDVFEVGPRNAGIVFEECRCRFVSGRCLADGWNEGNRLLSMMVRDLSQHSRTEKSLGRVELVARIG